MEEQGTSLGFCIKLLQEEEINLVAHDSNTRNISFKEEEIDLKQVSFDGSHATHRGHFDANYLALVDGGSANSN